MKPAIAHEVRTQSKTLPSQNLKILQESHSLCFSRVAVSRGCLYTGRQTREAASLSFLPSFSLSRPHHDRRRPATAVLTTPAPLAFSRLLSQAHLRLHPKAFLDLPWFPFRPQNQRACHCSSPSPPSFVAFNWIRNRFYVERSDGSLGRTCELFLHFVKTLISLSGRIRFNTHLTHSLIFRPRDRPATRNPSHFFFEPTHLPCGQSEQSEMKQLLLFFIISL